jgi:choline-glycine betaine transporter
MMNRLLAVSFTVLVPNPLVASPAGCSEREMSVDASDRNSAQASSCHGEQSGRSGKRPNRLWIVAGVAVGAIALGVAVDRQWLSLGALTPLILSLPCAILMFMCMRGMNRSAGADNNGQSDDRSAPR